jgi:recombination protein RecR
MYPEPIERLMRHFERLPGIGPKQAAKFAFRVMRMTERELSEFAKDLRLVKKETAVCEQCFLTYGPSAEALCPFCRNTRREQSLICVTETQRDAYTIENAQTFTGVYHVLGTGLSFVDLAAPPPTLSKLLQRVEAATAPPEIILAMNATLEGQATALWLERFLERTPAKVTRLGRGLSSGIEIEYADRDTLADAFKNRR